MFSGRRLRGRQARFSSGAGGIVIPDPRGGEDQRFSVALCPLVSWCQPDIAKVHYTGGFKGGQGGGHAAPQDAFNCEKSSASGGTSSLTPPTGAAPLDPADGGHLSP